MKKHIKKRKNFKKIFVIIICILILGSAIYCIDKTESNNKIIIEPQDVINYNSGRMQDKVYLSDIDYIESQSRAGYDKIRYDEVDNGGKITLKVEDSVFSFKKGIWAHATSQVVYDISSYNYIYFTAFVGLNTTSTRGDGVRFYIYTSKDGQNWGEAKFDEVKLPGAVATPVTIELNGANYIKLVADRIGNNTADHAVYADAKLVNDLSTANSPLKTIAEYDSLIKSEYTGQTEITGDLELNLLKRELLQRVGQFALTSFYHESEENKAVIDWLVGDVKNIREYILGGKPDGGSYYNSLTQLSRLYNEYKEDFGLTESLNNKYQPDLTYGDLYKKMAITLSLTHSKTVSSWMNAGARENQSDALRRYAIYKYMHKNGMLRKYNDESYAPMFEALKVEEMRLVLNNAIDDESILWLNEYTQDRLDEYKQDKWISPHPYIAYTQPNYNNPVFYDEANEDYFNELFGVKDKNNPEQIIGMWDLEYTIPGGKTIPSYNISVTRGTNDYKLQKVWMNFRNKFGTGAICGGISNSGANIRAAHGIPAFFAYQPYHGVTLNYAKNADGRGFWGIDNDCDGWALSSSAGTRFLMGWGLETWNIESPLNTQWLYMFKYNALYLVLGQEALNDYDNFVQCEEQTFLAKVYSEDKEQQEDIYNNALEKQKINLDAWVGLINTYKADTSKTEEEYYQLAERIARDMKYFPLPMKHLSNLIKPEFTSPEYIYQFTLLQERALKEASGVQNTETDKVVQPSLTRGEANFLLGRLDKTIATFSFDGEDAGKIILSSKFDGSGLRWDYSIVGKGNNENWTKERFREVSFTADEEHKWQLTPEELASITAENDLYIHIVGVDYSDKNVYKIDILPSERLPSTLYVSDLENKLLGATDNVEWKLNDSNKWTLYRDEEPDLTGNKTITVRMAATGTHIVGEEVEYTVTQDIVDYTRKYIPVSHLEIAGYSTQSQAQDRPFYAPNAIDGNLNTQWHTDFRQNVLQQTTKPFISIKLDEPRNISALEFRQKKYKEGNFDDIRNARVYVSIDGESWIQGGKIEECETYGELYAVNFDKPVYGQYVKIELDTKNAFASLALVNLYEDTTVVTIATFSFDGDNAGKLMITDEFNGKNWKYSLDGGISWNVGNGTEHQLTKTELEQINPDDGIIVRLAEENKETIIKIQKHETPVMDVYLNDLENRLINIEEHISHLEWKIVSNNEVTDNKEWTAYSAQEPIVTGNRKLLIRKKASSTLVASDSIEFQFTEDNQPNTEKYISISHLEVVGYSTQSRDSKRPHYASNVIDGKPNTQWHTDFSKNFTQSDGGKAYISIKLDEPRYISALQYLHIDSSLEQYGYAKNGKVYVSDDGENWTEVCEFENWAQDTEVKTVRLTESTKAQYVKFEISATYDNVFATAAMINLFEDTTKIDRPTAEIEYSITEPTNQNVVATLVNKSTDITVTNNDGKDTYTFEQDGTFTFEFVDSKGIKGSATATVNWIIKTLPTVTVQYSTEEHTNQDVTAEVRFSRDNVKILGEQGEVIQTIAKAGDPYTYTFTENSVHEIRFKGPHGNEGTTTLTVDWIDKIAPVGKIEYSSSNISNQPVIATVIFENEANEENVIITSEGGRTHTFTENGSFTFEFRDKAGNIGKAVATVDWIDKTLPVATIKYSTTEPTNQNVIAKVTFNKKNVQILSENGELLETLGQIGDAYIYTFTKNEVHEIRFKGPSGNKGSVMVAVDWIDRKAPIGKIEYSTEDLTNQDVTATITFDKEDVTITNNGGKNTYIFESNGIFTFEFVDKVGNIGSKTAEVQCIDKRQVNAKITYDINQITSKDVTASITFDKANVSILDEKGKVIYTVVNQGDAYTYKFTDNGIHEFKFRGPAGNTGIAVATVDWIDKIPPAAVISYDINEETEGPVTATIEFDEGGVTITNKDYEPIENGDTYVFTENGSYTFYYIGPLGNRGTAIATVNWIKTEEDKYQENKIKAIEKIEDYLYKVSSDEIENKKINAEEKSEVISAYDSLRDEDKVKYTEFINKIKAGGKPIITKPSTEVIKYKIGETIDLYSLITINDNEDGNIASNAENVKITTNLDIQKVGTYNVTYEVADSDENKVTLTIQVVIEARDSDEFNITSSEYEIKNGMVLNVSQMTTVDNFKTLISVNRTIHIVDKEGIEQTGENIVATGMKIKADNENEEYRIVVIGDLNGNGIRDIGDLAKAKLHTIDIELLENEYLQAFDVDKDGEISINDIAILKMSLIGLIDIDKIYKF